MSTDTNVFFNSLNLSSELLKAIQDMGFTNPTPIQAQAIPLLLENKDLIGQAQTGTGKTGAFGIPVVQKIDTSVKGCQALILCPTRELALQVALQIKLLAKFRPDLRVTTLVGGQPIEPQVRDLRHGVHIVVGTPGRVQDHMQRRTLTLDAITTVILDEADEMLDMGFRDDIEAILKETKSDRQTVLFSATMPPEMVRLANTYQKNPATVRLSTSSQQVPTIEQAYFEVDSRRKLDVLTWLLDIEKPKIAMIFCNTIQRVDEFTRKLQEAGYSVDALHGDMKQTRRDRVMDRFRTGSCHILVATDVAARGIDVQGIEVVFNIDLPMDGENYVHRIGRTGRAGKLGKAYSLVSGRDRNMLRTIQRTAGSSAASLEKRELPTYDTVERARADHLFTRVAEIVQKEKLEKYRAFITEKYTTDEEREQFMSALLKIAITKTQPVIEDFGAERGERSSREDRFGGGSRGGRSFSRPYRGRDGGSESYRPRVSTLGDDAQGGFKSREGRGGGFKERSDFGERSGGGFGGERRSPRYEGGAGRSGGFGGDREPRFNREGGSSFERRGNSDRAPYAPKEFGDRSDFKPRKRFNRE